MIGTLTAVRDENGQVRVTHADPLIQVSEEFLDSYDPSLVTVTSNLLVLHAADGDVTYRLYPSIRDSVTGAVLAELLPNVETARAQTR